MKYSKKFPIRNLTNSSVFTSAFLQCSPPLRLYDDNAFAVIIISQTQTMNFIIFPSIYDSVPSRVVECLNIRWLTCSLALSLALSHLVARTRRLPPAACRLQLERTIGTGHHHHHHHHGMVSRSPSPPPFHLPAWK